MRPTKNSPKSLSLPENRQKLITLFKQGASDSSIGRYFGIDHTTARYWRKKLGFNPLTLEQRRKWIKVVKPHREYGQCACGRIKSFYAILCQWCNKTKNQPVFNSQIKTRYEKVIFKDGKINQGKNYKDYLKEYERRKQKMSCLY